MTVCAERCPTAAWDMKRSQINIPQVGDEEAARDTRRRKTG